MGGKLPKSSLTVQDVADMVGRDRMVDVIGERRMNSFSVGWISLLTYHNLSQTLQLNHLHNGHLLNGQITS